MTAGLDRIWALAKSGIGGLYVLIGITSFFGYSELNHIKEAVQKLTPRANGSISQILDVARDPDADPVAQG